MVDSVSGTTNIQYITPDGQEVNIPPYLLGVVSMWARSKPLDMSNAQQNNSGKVKHISGVRLDLETDSEKTIPTGFQFRLGWSLDNQDQDIRWGDWKQISKLNEFIPYKIAGRYIWVEIQDIFPVVSWKLTKIEFYGRVMKGQQFK